MEKSPTLPYLDKRYKKAGIVNPPYPVLLRITIKRKRYYYPTGKSATETQWKTLNSDKPGKFKSTRDEINKIDEKAQFIIKEMNSFNYADFKNKMGDILPDDTLQGAFETKIRGFLTEGKIKSMRAYEAALVDLKAFKPRAMLKDVNVQYLKDYKQYVLAKGNSITTFSFHCRALRAIVNKAIAEKQYSRDDYPFGKYLFKIPKPAKKKNPVPTDHLNKLIYFKTADVTMAWARDMWLFAFYCGGRNPADLLHLKYEDVTDETITFNFRQKTKDSDEDQEPVILEIHDDLKQILNRWAQKRRTADTYVLPELKPSMTPEQIVDRRQDFGKKCNKYLKKISDDLEIPAIKMQQARHTAFNELKRLGHSTRDIQELAGHSSEKITEIYLKSMGHKINKTVGALASRKLKAV